MSSIISGLKLPPGKAMDLRWPSFLAVMSTLVLSGWVHGLWSGRWQPDEELLQAVARVEHVPMEIGGRKSEGEPADWTAESVDMDAKEFEQAGAMGHWVRRYTHRRTKHSMLVILMCGRPGKMSVHTPEVCYQGAGFALAGAPEPWTVTWLETSSERSATFWTTQFRKELAAQGPLRLFWGWKSGGAWQALKQPRWETKGEPFLYKIYIVEDAVEAEGQLLGEKRGQRPAAADTRWAQEFMQDFLPKLEETLFPQ